MRSGVTLNDLMSGENKIPLFRTHAVWVEQHMVSKHPDQISKPCPESGSSQESELRSLENLELLLPLI